MYTLFFLADLRMLFYNKISPFGTDERTLHDDDAV